MFTTTYLNWLLFCMFITTRILIEPLLSLGVPLKKKKKKELGSWVNNNIRHLPVWSALQIQPGNISNFSESSPPDGYLVSI